MCSDDGHTLQSVTQISISACWLPMAPQTKLARATRRPASSGITKFTHENGGPSASTLYGLSPNGYFRFAAHARHSASVKTASVTLPESLPCPIDHMPVATAAQARKGSPG